jgi:predicted PurR-regulated permease PerM
VTQDDSEDEAETGPAGSERPAPEEEQPRGDSDRPAAGRPVAPVIVPRWVQLVCLPLALLALWALARAAGSVLLIFVFASVIAIMFNPLVKRIQRVIPRGLAIAAVYLGGLALMGGVGVLLSNPVSNQVNNFAGNVPHLVDQANRELDSLQRFFNRNGIHVQIRAQGQTALQTLQKHVLQSSGSIVSFSRDLLGRLVQFSIDLVLVIVLSVYLLVYARQIGDLVRRIMPPGDGTAQDDYPLLIQRAVSGYVRGQLLFSLIMGASAGLSLWLLGVTGVFPDGSRYTLFFGAFYGLAEFIPYIGPIIGPLPAVLAALFADPISAVWVTLLFVALQQLEGHFVAPQVFRISLRINPILIILSLLIGYQLYGIAGALIALPVAAIVRQTVVYLRAHLVFEPWAIAAPAGSVLQLTGTLCAACGAAHDPHDAYCRACGAQVADEVSAYRETN